jgi:hypothetical protein
MPKLSQKRIAELTEMLLELLDALDLDDDQSDTVCEIFITRLWQRSGLDLPAFHAAARAALLQGGIDARLDSARLPAVAAAQGVADDSFQAGGDSTEVAGFFGGH